MKKTAVIMVVLLLLTAQACLAVDLEAGWYVKLGGVVLHGWDGTVERVVDWSFVGGLGIFGPFEVANPDPWWPQREVSVPSDAFGISAGTAVYLWGEPSAPLTFAVDEVVFRWETYYDASEMRIELLMHDGDDGLVTLWTQNASGLNSDYSQVLGGSQRIPVGYEPVFRVTAVPEVSPLLSFLVGMCSVLGVLRRGSR